LPVERSLLTATLSADHREVDGVDAARSITTYKAAPEAPDSVLASAAVA
jgi:pyruvate/2-oxoglutarate dehydrogenase complex dihydrolipoamide acyltransferase (E2) component